MGEIDKPVPGKWKPNTQLVIQIVCEEIKEMLLEKNRCYGDSAINPTRIFSKSDPIEQINVRIDDKLNRLMQGVEYIGDDTEKDLIGYLILKRVAQRIKDYEKTKVDYEHSDIRTRQVPTEQCACGGSDKVLERLGRKDIDPQPTIGIRKCKPDTGPGPVDDNDYEYAPTIQRNVFSDIIAKPK